MSTLDERPGVRDQIAAADRAWRAAGTPTAGHPDHLAEIERLSGELFSGDPADGRPAWASRSEDDSTPELDTEPQRMVFHYGPTTTIPNGTGDPHEITVNLEQHVVTTSAGEDRYTYVDLGQVQTVSVGAILQLAAALLNAADQLDGGK